MPAHIPNMPSTLAIASILQEIQQSTLQTIPNLLQHLFMSGAPEYQALISAIQSPTGTHLILNTLLHACHPTVTKWVMEVAQGIFRNEIIRASDVETGLHFKASQAHSAELTGFDIQHVQKKFEDVAPLMWGVIQTLLDVKPRVQIHQKKNLKKAVDYDSQHAECIDDLPVNTITDDGTYELDEVELHNESEDDMESVAINQEDKTLWQIVSCQIQPERKDKLLTCGSERMCNPLYHGQQYKHSM